jgi:hypothetical protein
MQGWRTPDAVQQICISVFKKFTKSIPSQKISTVSGKMVSQWKTLSRSDRPRFLRITATYARENNQIQQINAKKQMSNQKCVVCYLLGLISSPQKVRGVGNLWRVLVPGEDDDIDCILFIHTAIMGQAMLYSCSREDIDFSP